MPISADDLRQLKNPFGELIPDSDVSQARVTEAIGNAVKIVAVGDATTDRLVSFGIFPDIAVIDGRVRRSKSSRKIGYDAKEFACSNPPGVVKKEAVQVLVEAIKGSKRSRIDVDGEEDMLALPLFYLLPIGSVVLYGQPLEGLVVVRITKSKQKEAKDLMDRIGMV
jgi:uncharacterized protein (UPF0218 family)